MKTESAINDSAASIWRRVFDIPEQISDASARLLLKIQFSEADHTLMAELSRKAQAGTLSQKEQAELDAYESLGCLLDIMHSKVRQALRKKPKRAS